MNAEDCLVGRRSVRKYTEEPISVSQLEEIVALARYAPSWKNQQPTRYHVVMSEGVISRIADKAVAGFTPNARTMLRCRALVIVTVKKKLSGFEKDGTPSTPQGTHWQSFDAGIAVQTFCLAAHCKGIGSVVLGIFDEKELRKIVSLPEDEQVACLLAMGYPLVTGKPAPPRLSVAELLDIIEEPVGAGETRSDAPSQTQAS